MEGAKTLEDAATGSVSQLRNTTGLQRLESGMPANDKQRRGAIRTALILLAIVIALFVTVIVKNS
jgi:hypothetical protein